MLEIHPGIPIIEVEVRKFDESIPVSERNLLSLYKINLITILAILTRFASLGPSTARSNVAQTVFTSCN